MISNGERFVENLKDLKFILLLFNKIFFNKQMFISLIIFLIILSRYIHLDKNLKKITVNKKIFSNELSFTLLTILSYSFILFVIFVSSEGSPNNVPEIKYFMTITSADRLFLPVHSLILIFSIYLNKKI